MADHRSNPPPAQTTIAPGGAYVLQVNLAALTPSAQALLMNAARVANADPASFVVAALNEWAAFKAGQYAGAYAPQYPPGYLPPGYQFPAGANPYHSAFAGGGYPGAADYRQAFGY